jgi:signal transduction histidine kinase
VAIWSTAALVLVHQRLQGAANAHLRSREELLQGLERKNAELERFAHTVSHDLKSPLVTIKGFLGHLERSARASDFTTLKADIACIAAAADRMRALVDGLLELSRIGRIAGPPATVRLSEIVDDALSALSGPIKRAGVTVEVAPSLPEILGDRVRIQQALQNLIENAVKFSATRPEPRVEIGARCDGPEVLAWVKDNGIGVDARHAKLIFELFEQLDRNAEGTGVGLTVVKRVIETHGGRVWVESEGAGAGSTFSFTLPAPTSAGREDDGSHARAGA